MADTIKCKDCGKSFEITNEEKQWYADKGYDLPKRCKYCRKARKANTIVKENKYGEKQKRKKF